ncbi:phosphatidylserine decarboxylase family protein [Sporomusa acidovorans]|uniref:Phosphatidylserine decarboxylase proenzyme n=1 Tax=Sporomusa acidovorans (strain ATCC 49682 / DSM 3132 / Mol) TaxID=1123286 RepID=A0ABZ3J5I6_SPOA4|nr:phosphatidylserine decarboxylase family protein [Sporomusa acidovorans]OZC23544.1 phosphatidylserine decarboxylase proenzyme [Sporomusa acidovorans DSM 3132]SDF46763.1 phosphatidylserine decarboxylase [Sporomusa acidovorans]
MIAKEGYPYIAFFITIAIIIEKVFDVYWSILPAVLGLYVTYFFRNPKRNVIYDPELVLAPADGKVMSIEKIFEDQFFNGPAIKVTIFLSIFDVHINRIPVEGNITFQNYICGKLKPAYKSSAPFENERHAIGLENDNGMKVMIIQVAGILARRIVSWVNLGDRVQQGQRYGMIKFGSCTEIIMPINVAVSVAKGEHVKGGKTIIGRITPDNK